MLELVKIKGEFFQRIYKIVSGEKILIEKYEDKNLVVNLGKQKICKLIANDGVNNYVNSISFGTSIVNPTIADISITDPFNKGFTGYTYETDTSVTFEWELLTTEANGKSITEYGLICADSTLFSRKVRGSIEKESDIYIDGSWKITII